MPIDTPLDLRPIMVTEHVIGEDRLRQRGAALVGEALADFSPLTPAWRHASLSGLPGTLVLVDGLRLTPAANGQVDLSLLPLAWFDSAELSAGPVGAAHGAGSIAGALNLSLSPANSGTRVWALGGTQSGRGLGGLDLRVGDDFGWVGGGFTQGGALADPAGLAATRQARWHLGGRLSQNLGGATLSGTALLASRREGVQRADYHDLSARVGGGTVWRWQVAVAIGGHHEALASSRQTLLVAHISRVTELTLPWAVDPVSITFGGETRDLRLSDTRVKSQALYAEAYVPLLQDRPVAENLGVELGWRQAWIAGRSEPLWKARARWEFFPGLSLRGQVARGVDDLGSVSGIGRSIGLFAAPAFLPGFSLALDWRSQSAGPAKVQAVDVSAYLRRRLAGAAQITLEALATHHQQAELTPLPVARFQSVLRARVEQQGWAAMVGWRHRTPLASIPTRDWLDIGIERQLSSRVRVIASIGNVGDAGSAAAPVGRQALLQLVAGF